MREGGIEMIDITGLREDKRPQSSTIVHALLDRLEAAEKERDALRAKIERMEQQEPVALVESWANGSYSRNYHLQWLRDVNEGARLYALPGAQPAPSMASGDVSLISEGKTQHAPSVPGDILRDAVRYRFLRAAKNIPISSKAARDPVVYDAAIDAAMLAAAPEAKP